MSREDILVELIGSIYYCSKPTIMVSNQWERRGGLGGRWEFFLFLPELDTVESEEYREG
jgi:hypothetical protein